MRKKISSVFLVFVMVLSMFAGAENVYAGSNYVINQAKLGTTYKGTLVDGKVKVYSINIPVSGMMQVQAAGLTEKCTMSVYEEKADPSDFSAYFCGDAKTKTFNVIPGKYMFYIENNSGASTNYAFMVSFKPVMDVNDISVETTNSKDNARVRVVLTVPSVTNGYYEIKTSLYNKGKIFNTKKHRVFSTVLKKGTTKSATIKVRLCIKVGSKIYTSKSVVKTINISD